MELVAERLKGEIAKADIVAADGRVLVQKDKRITAKSIRDIQNAGITRLEVPHDVLFGKVVASDVVDRTTGEIILRANDEITEETIAKLALGSVTSWTCCTPTSSIKAPLSRKPCVRMTSKRKSKRKLRFIA